MIKKDFIERVLERADIVEVISEFVELKKAGSNYKGLSPFTKEKSGSFMVSPAKQLWKDFSSGNGGKAVNFLMKVKNMTYPEAITFLANKYHMTVEFENEKTAKEYKEKQEKKQELRPVLEAVHQFYVKEFLKLPNDHPAKIETKRRGYTEEDCIEWQIGYAPKNVLYNTLAQRAWVQPALDLGLIKQHHNNYYDVYSERLIFPIFNSIDTLIGFAGRDLSGQKESPKWINPAVNENNLLYNKSTTWYGLDKAIKTIKKNDTAIIVEGYNDVIACHKYGMLETVAACGTAITKSQILNLKKICNKVIFLMDPDDAGKRAVLKYIEEFLSCNIRVEVNFLELDPDDYCRKYHQELTEGNSLEKIVKGKSEDGFAFLMKETLTGSEVEKSAKAKELALMVDRISEDTMKELYLGWLSKTTKIKATTINKWIADNKKNSRIIEYNEDYELPKEVTIPFSELEKDIKKFGIFMANNKTWIISNPASEDKKYFKSISNFEIEILQHLADEKYPAYLTRMKNVEGKEVVFDCPSTIFNALIRFKDELTRFRNFIFTGKNDELEKLFIFLSEKSGSGAKVEVLGWQYDGEFWAWNNLIIKDEETYTLDANGRYVQREDHYYLPSANIVYAKNRNKFKNQKEFLHLENKHDFYKILLTTAKVHRHHYISPLLYTIACMFRDIVVDKLNHFPILFLYGRAGTGKDELARMLMSFYGKTRITTSLESNSSTQKANLRMLAQIRNGIAMMSEYKTGNPGLDGALKGIYDNLGYNIGTMESKISTDTIPIESGVILTGNYFPDAEALIQRVIWNQMDKDIFNEDEKENMRAWQEMIKDTLSSHTTMLLKKRKLVEDKFLEIHSSWNKTLTNLFPDVKTRMLDNLAIISSFYDIFKDVIRFPFSETELLDHYKVGLDQQMYRLNANSLIAKFWECFVISFEGMPTKRIEIGNNIKIENKGNSLSMFIRWTAVHAIISERWFVHFKEAAPKKDLLLEEIKKIPGLFIENHSTYRFSPGRDGIKSSAIELNIKNLQANVINDIIGAYQKQSYSQPLLFEEGLSSLYVNDNESPEQIQKEIENQKQINDPEMPF